MWGIFPFLLFFYFESHTCLKQKIDKGFRDFFFRNRNRFKIKCKNLMGISTYVWYTILYYITYMHTLWRACTSDANLQNMFEIITLLSFKCTAKVKHTKPEKKWYFCIYLCCVPIINLLTIGAVPYRICWAQLMSQFTDTLECVNRES